jgi:hypothetical protein
VLKDTKLFKSTKSVPMAGFYGHFLENPDWRSAAFITMGYRRLTGFKMNCRVKNIPGRN